jgi:hypothetical protein
MVTFFLSPCRFGALFLCASVGLAGCNAWAPVYSLKRQVNEGAIDYGEVMADFADQALLTNVLRAKDNAPLNFNDLASITGSFSLTDTYGLTLPFGGITGMPTGSSTHRYTASPMIAGTSSPVVSLSTLNTQGFMMTMVQPVSTTYILSKWDSHPHDLLLYLFVKSIRFPGEVGDGVHSAPRRVHRNDPDNPADFKDFHDLVTQLVDTSATGGNVDMKSLMILDPLGNPVPMGQTVAATTPSPSSAPGPGIPDASSASLYAGTQPNTVRPTPRGTYFVQLTLVGKNGESQASKEETVVVSQSGLEVVVYSPPALGGDWTGFNVYVGKVSGTVTKQNTAPLKFDSAHPWILPDGDPKAGPAPPPSDIEFPRYPGLADNKVSYALQVTYATNSGGETPPSPESTKAVEAYQALRVSMPQGTASGVLGYNVYLRGADGVQRRQNDAPVPLTQPWTKNYDGTHAGPSVPSPAGTSYQVSSDFSIFQTINGLGDGQLHAGNASCPESFLNGAHTGAGDVCASGSKAPLAQFYKEYPGQIVLCVHTDDDNKLDGHLIAPLSPEEIEARTRYRNSLAGSKSGDLRGKTTAEFLNDLSTVKAHIDGARVKAIAMAKPPPASPQTPAAGGAAAPAGGGAPATVGGGAAGGSMGQVTMALQPSRISAMVREETCNTDEVILPQGTDEDYHKESGEFTHIEWRSIAEVIQYLGAVARLEDTTGAAVTLTTEADTLFALKRDATGRVHVSYRGTPISVGASFTTAAQISVADPHDHSLESLAMLNELISLAKISGNVGAPQTVQVVP